MGFPEWKRRVAFEPNLGKTTRGGLVSYGR